MTKFHFDACFASASSLSSVQARMTVLMNLLNAPAEFYADDVGIPCSMIQTLKHAHLIQEVPGKTKDAFIRVNDREDLYKRVPVKCWRLTLDRKAYREGLTEYIKEATDVFASALLLTAAFPC
ncbi:MAG: hypothetical protein J6R54_09760 [Bacteroidaceae bacterium]|nr:hypothetical protein [Bacteroidaceae bacterium]